MSAPSLLTSMPIDQYLSSSRSAILLTDIKNWIKEGRVDAEIC